MHACTPIQLAWCFVVDGWTGALPLSGGCHGPFCSESVRHSDRCVGEPLSVVATPRRCWHSGRPPGLHPVYGVRCVDHCVSLYWRRMPCLCFVRTYIEHSGHCKLVFLLALSRQELSRPARLKTLSSVRWRYCGTVNSYKTAVNTVCIYILCYLCYILRFLLVVCLYIFLYVTILSY